MQMTKKMTLVAAALAASAAALADVPSISGVTVEQDPGTRLVTVSYVLSGAAAVVTADISVGGTRMKNAELASLSGDVNRRVAEGAEERKIRWMPDGLEFTEDALEVELTAWSVHNPPDYMMFNCMMTNATVRYYAASDQIPFEGGISNELCKTEYLLMRKIPARGIKWLMGSKTGSGDTSARWVTLSDNYYLAVYDMTAQQARYLGFVQNWNSTFIDGYSGDAQKPVTGVSPADLRGALTTTWRGWPQEGHAVREGSQIYKFRQATPVELDLPTSAQWEFAARAGSGGFYPDGTAAYSAEVLGRYAWYSGNVSPAGAVNKVGLKEANAWGLFDVLGNVYDYCLDWHDAGTVPVDETDPKGPDNADKSIVNRVVRSFSSWNDVATCTLFNTAGLNDGRSYRLCAPCYAPGEGSDGEEGDAP